MYNREFVRWMEGYFELMPEDALDRKKLFIIKNHLNLVMAVEGKLGELNAGIFKDITKAIDENYEAKKLKELRSNIQEKILCFVKNFSD